MAIICVNEEGRNGNVNARRGHDDHDRHHGCHLYDHHAIQHHRDVHDALLMI